MPSSALASGPLRVIFPQPESRSDNRPSYPLAVLKLALEHSGREFALQPSAAPMQQARSLKLLADGSLLDVAWSVTSIERERHLRPVRIPIDFGLIGWRVLLIRRDDAARFAGIDSVAGLDRLVAGQGHDWPDLTVLRDNGLQVIAATTYDGLFAMLERGRIDYVPRAISEVLGEADAHAGLSIEPRLLLHYPSALYFFVNPGNGALAEAIESGLESCLADGSLRARFDQEYAQAMMATRPGEHRVLELVNSDLPAATPLARRQLWVNPVAAVSR